MRGTRAFCVALTAMCLVIAGARSSEAGAPLTTGFLLLGSNQYIRCFISNPSTKEVVVDKIESVDSSGIASLQRNPFTLAPGATEPNVFVFSSARCVFSLKKRKVVRAYGCVANIGSLLCLTESEAR